MKVWIIDILVYYDKLNKKIKLEHGKVYSVNKEWGKLIVSNEVGAEYIKEGELQ